MTYSLGILNILIRYYVLTEINGNLIAYFIEFMLIIQCEILSLDDFVFFVFRMFQFWVRSGLLIIFDSVTAFFV